MYKNFSLKNHDALHQNGLNYKKKHKSRGLKHTILVREILVTSLYLLKLSIYSVLLLMCN